MTGAPLTDTVRACLAVALAVTFPLVLFFAHPSAETFKAYQDALLKWTKTGGTDPLKVHLPEVISAKVALDEAAAALVAHRKSHGC